MDRMERLRKDGAEDPLHAHILGSTAQNLSGIAQALRQQGMKVTTSLVGDFSNPGVSRRLGKMESTCHRLPPDTSILLHSSDVPRHHPTMLAAMRRSIPRQSASEMLALAMRSRIGVVVAGGRLAGMTASMIGWILTHSGKDPTVFLEKPSKQIGGCSRLGSGAHFIAEWSGDPGELVAVKPSITLFLDLGPDDEMSRTLENGITPRGLDRYLEQTDSGLVLALGHPSRFPDLDLDPDSKGWNSSWDKPLETFSLRRGSDWWGTDLRQNASGPRFRVFHRGEFVIEVRLRIFGVRNILSALAAVSACRALGVSSVEIGDALEDYQGTAHDLQIRGSFRGVTLVDDPAREPGAIRETLKLARQLFPSRRLWAVLEAPELDLVAGSLRIDRLQTALADADRVLLIHPVDAIPGDRFDGLESPLLKILNDAALNPKARQVSDPSEAISVLDEHLQPGDVLLTLGAGELGTIADAFIRRLSRDRQDG